MRMSTAIALAWLLAAGCSEESEPSSGQDAGATAVDVGNNDHGEAGFALDELDKQLIEALDAVHVGLGKAPVWPGFPLVNKPLYLVRRTLKGKPSFGLLTHVASGPNGAVEVGHGQHVLWRVDDEIGFLGKAEHAYAWRKIAGHDATFAAYDLSTTEDIARFIGEVAKASFVRMRELEQKWAPVEGCGRTVYPRNKQLIELTLLEDALLAEVLDAGPAELPQRVTEVLALRAERIKIEPYVLRMDNDGENRFGTPHFAAMHVPVAAGVRTTDELKALLKEQLKASMTLPIEELDDHLMWGRQLPATGVLVPMARAAGAEVEETMRGGKSVHEALLKKHGSADLTQVEAIKKRHDMKKIAARAAELMAL